FACAGGVSDLQPRSGNPSGPGATTILLIQSSMTDPKPELPARPISELVADPEFPTSAVGARVDIKGFIGVVAGVVKNSIKVRSADGNTVSYNFHALRRLYGSPIPAEPAPASPPEPESQPGEPVILEPDFNAPLVPIEALVPKAGFPACALGIFVDLHGFTGVVVELVGRSLKVRSREGATRSYNADGLRTIYAKARAASPTAKLGHPSPWRLGRAFFLSNSSVARMFS